MGVYMGSTGFNTNQIKPTSSILSAQTTTPKTPQFTGSSAEQKAIAIFTHHASNKYPAFQEKWPLYLFKHVLEDPDVAEYFTDVLDVQPQEFNILKQQIQELTRSFSRKGSLSSFSRESFNTVKDSFEDFRQARSLTRSPVSMAQWLLSNADLVTELASQRGVPQSLQDKLFGINEASQSSPHGSRVASASEAQGVLAKTGSTSHRVPVTSGIGQFSSPKTTQISEREYFHLLNSAEREAKSKILRQDPAIEQLIRAFKAHYLNQSDEQHLEKPGRPWVRVMLYGPSGVGKTTLLHILTEVLKRPVLLKRMNEYKSDQSVIEFKGPGQGIKGYMDGTSFPERLEHLIKTSSRPPIVFLDEVEKAHPDIQHILMGLLDDGRIAKANGEEVDASSVDFIMTTNAGIAIFSAAFKDGKRGEELESIAQDAMNAEFPTEFRYRVSDAIFLRPLEREDAKAILENELNKWTLNFKQQRNIDLKIEATVKEHLLDLVYSPQGGVRNLKDQITSQLKVPLIDELSGKYPDEYFSRQPLQVKVGFEPQKRKYAFVVKK